MSAFSYHPISTALGTIYACVNGENSVYLTTSASGYSTERQSNFIYLQGCQFEVSGHCKLKDGKVFDALAYAVNGNDLIFASEASEYARRKAFHIYGNGNPTDRRRDIIYTKILEGLNEDFSKNLRVWQARFVERSRADLNSKIAAAKLRVEKAEQEVAAAHAALAELTGARTLLPVGEGEI